MTSLNFFSDLKRLSFGLCLLGGLFPANSPAQPPPWQPIGISGGRAMFTPAISPAEPNLMKGGLGGQAGGSNHVCDSAEKPEVVKK